MRNDVEYLHTYTTQVAVCLIGNDEKGQRMHAWSWRRKSEKKEIWRESKTENTVTQSAHKSPRRQTSGELPSKRVVHVYDEESDWCE
ncbi:unnamed protein product [Sphenostylis stenocarpa]|uniref:Uncharacterized protein n=1 Tax=Sphenostylis stenocarpa TaxID=92480 RepID=A0AA86RTI7_9FABA|nr:unnamed protein product [Sphenostylis stenocarpa]